MPLLPPEPPLFELRELTDDPGLNYLESQKAWRHTYSVFVRKVLRYMAYIEGNPHDAPKPKSYPACREMKIPYRREFLDGSFAKLLGIRRTRRQTKPGSKLTAEQIGTLLMASFGAREFFAENPKPPPYPNAYRTVAGGGGIHPVEIYLMAWNIDGLQPGIYHFHPLNGTVVLIDDRNPYDLAVATIPGEDAIRIAPESSGMFAYTSVFERSKKKYGNRYLRFCILEVGAVYQNMDLAASAMDLMLYPQGSFYEAEMNQALGIDGVGEACLHMALIGP